MDKSLRDAVSASRHSLKNQYAHLEYLEEFAAEDERSGKGIDHDARIGASRKILENPYAYLDESGRFAADPDVVAHNEADGASRARRRPRRWSDREIEEVVGHLHGQIWRERTSIREGPPPSDPVDLLEPALALRMIGFQFVAVEGLEQLRMPEGLREAAGELDRSSRIVRISRQLNPRVQRFTAAHELGHAMLHPSGLGVHRDRPLDGTERSRDPIELEADKFATYFLMPANLVKARFLDLFKTDRFELTEDSLFALGLSPSDIRDKRFTRRDLSRRLASVERFNGRQISSLAAQFVVSTEAMAIRLEELGLLP